MTRRALASAMVMLLVAGCSDSRRPAVRESLPEPDASSPMPGPSAGSLHGAPHGTAMAEALGPEVVLGTMRLVAPENWSRKPVRSGFLLAEFSLPRAEADAADARLTVTAVGGSVEANVARWRGQFGGGPDAESQEEIEIAGIPVTLVDFSGAYVDEHAGLGTGIERPDYRVRAAIFQVDGQQYIVKCYGPKKTMEEHADEFLQFLRSLGPVGSVSAPSESGEAETAGEQAAGEGAAEAPSGEEPLDAPGPTTPAAPGGTP